VTALRDTPTRALLAEVHHRWSDIAPELVAPLREVRVLANITDHATEVAYLRSTGDAYDAAIANLLATIAENHDDLGKYGTDITKAAQRVRDLAVRRAAA